MKIAIKAPAKVNFSLDVLGKRPDGYHELRSVFQTVSLYDVVTIETSSEADFMEVISEDGSVLSEAETGVPTDGRNLMMKAVRKLRETAGCDKIPPVRMTLLKRIPSQAGLGGGSSDAAAVLYGLNRMFRLEIDQTTLLKTAATIGADVPFLLVGGTCDCRGIGEIIFPMKPLNDVKMLLVKPKSGASTKEIFEKLDTKTEIDHPNTDDLIDALSKEPIDIATAFFAAKNVLQPITEEICPEVAKICGEMQKTGAIRAFMSGSGTACVGIYNGENMRNFALQSLSEKYPENCYFSVNSTQVGLEEIPI